jgi:hypothetical protein
MSKFLNWTLIPTIEASTCNFSSRLRMRAFLRCLGLGR